MNTQESEDNTPMNNFDTQNAKDNFTGWIQTGVYYDGNTAGDSTARDHGISVEPAISNERIYPSYTGGDTDDNYGYVGTEFKNTTVLSGYTPPYYLKQLALQPISSNLQFDALFCRNYGERIPVIGGAYGDGINSGVFAMKVNSSRSSAYVYTGLRSAFIAL